MPPDGGSISWRLGGGGRGVLEDLTSLIILSCVSEYLEGGREGGKEGRREGGKERGREGGREGVDTFIHTLYTTVIIETCHYTNYKQSEVLPIS